MAISIRVLGSSVYQTLVQITVVWDTTIIDATIDFIHAYACTLLCSEECKDGCTKAWLFAEGPRDSQMAVSECGSHGQKDVVHIRRRLAKQYAQTHTGGVALLKMEEKWNSNRASAGNVAFEKRSPVQGRGTCEAHS